MPVVEKIAGEFAGRARVAKVHVDKENRILDQFGSSSIPAYLLFRDGKEVDRISVTFVSWFLEARMRRMVDGALDDEPVTASSGGEQRVAKSFRPIGGQSPPGRAAADSVSALR